MLASLDSLPNHTRVWIYQGNREFTLREIEIINATLTAFCQQWAAHGAPLQSNFVIRENRFVILLVNEEAHASSGCSIDGSVRVMKGLQQQLDIDFFDRTQVAFWISNQIQTFATAELKNAFSSGKLSSQSILINTLASTKHELDLNWKIEVQNSWLKKYLPVSV